MSELATLSNESAQPPRGRAGVRQLWVDRLARFPASGLNPAAFCAAEGVSLPSFYSWKRRLAVEAQDTANEPTASAPRPLLLPVRLPSACPGVELVLPGGAVLRLTPGCDLTFVRSLVAALGEPPC
jgi:hypothetical protein